MNPHLEAPDVALGPTRELLAQIETVEIPAEIAGYPATNRRNPAHRRLAKRRRISPEIETEIEQFSRDWEMVEGGAHEVGSGGDGAKTREEVMSAAIIRIALATKRIGRMRVQIVAAACVECEPAWVTAKRLGHVRACGECGHPAEILTERHRRDAREWLDGKLPAILSAMTKFPLDPTPSTVSEGAGSPKVDKEQSPP